MKVKGGISMPIRWEDVDRCISCGSDELVPVNGGFLCKRCGSFFMRGIVQGTYRAPDKDFKFVWSDTE